MAVACEFIDIIVPIEKIDEAYPGGFAAFKDQHADMFSGRLWHDEHLFRDGAMSPQDAKVAVDFWREHGLEPMGCDTNGAPFWNDLCVVESARNGPTLPCNWIEFSLAERCVWKSGTEIGEIIGRGNHPLSR